MSRQNNCAVFQEDHMYKIKFNLPAFFPLKKEHILYLFSGYDPSQHEFLNVLLF